MNGDGNFIEIRHRGDGAVVAVRGRFDWQAAEGSRDLLSHPPQVQAIDMAEATEIDTVGALFLTRLAAVLGPDVGFLNMRSSFQRFFADVAAADQGISRQVRRTARFADAVVSLGAIVSRAVHQAAAYIAFLGTLALVYGRVAARPRRLRLTSIVHHVQDVGVRALPITGLLAVLLGVVLAYQGADQLRRFGATIYVVNLLGVSILRELGVIITSIVVAGRSGSAFTAEIGTMKVNQEVDAMRTMDIDPMEALVLPRVTGLLIALPLLVICSDILALAGGAAMSRLTLGISIRQFLSQFRTGIPLHFLWAGLVKAPVFAVLIGVTGCFQGMRVSGSAESVGSHTTLSVVQSICLVIVFDAVFSLLFGWLRF